MFLSVNTALTQTSRSSSYHFLPRGHARRLVAGHVALVHLVVEAVWCTSADAHEVVHVVLVDGALLRVERYPVPTGTPIDTPTASPTAAPTATPTPRRRRRQRGWWPNSHALATGRVDFLPNKRAQILAKCLNILHTLSLCLVAHKLSAPILLEDARRSVYWSNTTFNRVAG